MRGCHSSAQGGKRSGEAELWRSIAHAGLLIALLLTPTLDAQVTLPEKGLVIIDATQLPERAKPVFRVGTDTRIIAEGDAIKGTVTGELVVLQGLAERVSISLTGAVPLESVTGEHITGWAERRDDQGRRFLDLDLRQEEKERTNFAFEARWSVRRGPEAAVLDPTLPGPGAAAGFAGVVELVPGGDWTWEMVESTGMTLLEEGKYQANAEHSMRVRPARASAVPPPAALSGVVLQGALAGDGESAGFTLLATVVVRDADAVLPILKGRAAVVAGGSGDDWRLVTPEDGGYAMAFDREGSFNVEIQFEAKVIAREGWRSLDFALPGTGSGRLALEGWPEEIAFRADAAVLPAPANGGWLAFLPASGVCDVAWRASRRVETGRLFMNSSARIDVLLSAGVLRQDTRIELRILQGSLKELEFAMQGGGEITEVKGTNVSGWEVIDSGAGRRLRLTLSRPVTETAGISILSQEMVGDFPATVSPLRLTPATGESRHSGLLRARSDGAVRFAPLAVSGLMQLSNAHWGSKEEEDSRQVTVYRFPTPEYDLQLEARQVFPEVAVNQVTVYDFTETDRVINANVELDIREAPLREWNLGIPAGYVASMVQGTEVADSMATDLPEGGRNLRITFGRPVSGRALIQLRLEKNEAAAAGDWGLVALEFPDARTVRGFIGVAAARGYRLEVSNVEGAADLPLSLFPDPVERLQQAFRLREAEWTATLAVERLERSVDADVFHLYSLKEGVAYGSVIMNMFVVGAPVNEWRVAVPPDAGNLVIDAQEIRSWRREGDEVIIELSRPAMGASTVLATFEHAMSARGGTVPLGVVQPMDAVSERGYIQIVSPLQVRLGLENTESLLPVESAELPTELQLLSNAPSLAVYQYAGRPMRLDLKVEWFDRAEPVGQVVDFAKLDTRVSADGQVVTEAEFFVKTRGVGFLSMELAEDAVLWETKVNGAHVIARSEGNKTLVPLPPVDDPETAVKVAIRYGGTNKVPWRVKLAAPVINAPVLAVEWKAAADQGRLLVPRRSDSLHAVSQLTETGFEWLGSAGGKIYFWMLAAGALGAVAVMRFVSGTWWGKTVAGISAVVLLVLCAGGMLAAFADRSVNEATLSLVAPVMGSGQEAEIVVRNLPTWMAMISWSGIFTGLLGVAVALAGLMKAGNTRVLCFSLGWALMATGLLMQRGGMIAFLVLAGGSLIVALVRAGMRGWKRPAMALLAGMTLLHGVEASGQDAAALEITQRLEISGERVSASAELAFDGKAGDAFLLLRTGAVLREFEGDGVRLNQVDGADGVVFYAVLEQTGRATATLRYELPLAADSRGFALPTGPAIAHEVTVVRDEPGWSFDSKLAVRVDEVEGLPENASGAQMVFAPAAHHFIAVTPRLRDPSTEELAFFAETTTLFVPRPGVVDARHRVRVRVARGEMRELVVTIPRGFTVGDVQLAQADAPDWRFDPDAREVRVILDAPARGEFSLDVISQTPSGALPHALELTPARVAGATDEAGMLALAFDQEAQPESLTPTGLMRVNFEDLDEGMLALFEESDRPVLHRVFRFGAEDAVLEVNVTAVEPEIRANTQQLLSLGDERLTLAVDVRADVRKAGIFQWSFAIPAGLEMETLSGPAVSHWNESGDEGNRRVVVHFKERILGKLAMDVNFSGPPPGPAEAWQVPVFALENASRSEGELLVVPDAGLRIRPLERVNISQMDAREAWDQQPGSLAFRLLQADWELSLGIDAQEAWVTAQLLRETLVREGQLRHRMTVDYRIENAPVRVLRIVLPPMDDEAARSVRATGTAVSDMVRNAETAEWEVRLRNAVMGNTSLVIEYQERQSAEKAGLELQPVQLQGVRQWTSFSAVHSSGRLQLDAPGLPRGWQKADWNNVPQVLRDQALHGMPPMLFRLVEAAAPLELGIRRQEVAAALKSRISQANFATAFSPFGNSVTAAVLEMRVSEKASMALVPGTDARLFHLSMNGEDVPVVRDGDRYLFYVNPPADPNAPALVEFAYESPGHGRMSRKVELTGPGFDVPVENLEWKVMVPEGWELGGYSGALTLQRTGFARRFGMDEYLGLVSSNRAAKMESSTKLMTEAGEFLRQNDLTQARVALNRAARMKGVDEATNEDARVQLRNLYNQQAVLGLNTRRQKLYLDNQSADAPEANQQLEQAARENPLLQGQRDFDIAQIDQLLAGNTLEEANALRRIADRIVAQQFAAEPAPRSIGLDLPPRGTETVFRRSVQVDGSEPLELTVNLRRSTGGGNGGYLLFLGSVVAVVFGVIRMSGPKPEV